MLLETGSQQLRYGERTARGIAAGGGKVAKAVTLEGRKRARSSSKKIMVSRDAVREIGLFRQSAAYAPDTGRKPDTVEGMAARRVERGSCSAQREGQKDAP
jgi:hypothetical protein